MRSRLFGAGVKVRVVRLSAFLVSADGRRQLQRRRFIVPRESGGGDGPFETAAQREPCRRMCRFDASNC